ncbi:MAG: DODA-type extradiol aromatic ring-opening family dioxygenase [Rhodospirillaceae bacterium]
MAHPEIAPSAQQAHNPVPNAQARHGSVFVSHGSPMLIAGSSPAKAFLADLARVFPDRPQAILMASAHWLSADPLVTGAAKPDTIHDFYGFPDALYQLRYPAPGDPALAAQLVQRLQASGYGGAQVDSERGLDHGAWVPLLLGFPDADIPVLQISLDPWAGPEGALALGAVFAGLWETDRIAVIGSGSLTHDLGRFREVRHHGEDVPEEADVTAFADWIGEKIAQGDLAALKDYRDLSPHGAAHHPTEEHFLPLFFAMGAGGFGPDAGGGDRLHVSSTHGVLSMDAYGFSPSA